MVLRYHLGNRCLYDCDGIVDMGNETADRESARKACNAIQQNVQNCLNHLSDCARVQYFGHHCFRGNSYIADRNILRKHYVDHHNDHSDENHWRDAACCEQKNVTERLCRLVATQPSTAARRIFELFCRYLPTMADPALCCTALLQKANGLVAVALQKRRERYLQICDSPYTRSVGGIPGDMTTSTAVSRTQSLSDSSERCINAATDNIAICEHVERHAGMNKQPLSK